MPAALGDTTLDVHGITARERWQGRETSSLDRQGTAARARFAAARSMASIRAVRARPTCPAGSSNTERIATEKDMNAGDSKFIFEWPGTFTVIASKSGF